MGVYVCLCVVCMSLMDKMLCETANACGIQTLCSYYVSEKYIANWNIKVSAKGTADYTIPSAVCLCVPCINALIPTKRDYAEIDSCC